VAAQTRKRSVNLKVMNKILFGGKKYEQEMRLEEFVYPTAIKYTHRWNKYQSEYMNDRNIEWEVSLESFD